MNQSNFNVWFSFGLVLFNAGMLAVDGFATASYALSGCPRSAVASLCFAIVNFLVLTIGVAGLLNVALEGLAKGSPAATPGPRCEQGVHDWRLVQTVPGSGIKCARCGEVEHG